MGTYRTAKAILVSKTGKVLLLRRSATHPTEGLKFDLPGGVVEQGEDNEAALTREILEETGLTLSIAELRLIFTRTNEKNGKIAFRFIYAISVKQDNPTIQLSWEHDKAIWTLPAKAVEKLVKGKYTQEGLRYAIKNKLL